MEKPGSLWVPSPGERVKVLIENPNGVHGSVPRDTYGTVTRHLDDHERFPYEVEVNQGTGIKGKYTYALEELSPAGEP